MTQWSILHFQTGSKIDGRFQLFSVNARSNEQVVALDRYCTAWNIIGIGSAADSGAYRDSISFDMDFQTLLRQDLLGSLGSSESSSLLFEVLHNLEPNKTPSASGLAVEIERAYPFGSLGGLLRSKLRVGLAQMHRVLLRNIKSSRGSRTGLDALNISCEIRVILEGRDTRPLVDSNPVATYHESVCVDHGSSRKRVDTPRESDHISVGVLVTYEELDILGSQVVVVRLEQATSLILVALGGIGDSLGRIAGKVVRLSLHRTQSSLPMRWVYM